MKLQTTLLALIMLSGCAAAPRRPASIARGDYTSTQAYVTKLIQYEMDKNKVAGLSIALVDDQRIIWADGFGYADQARKIPATSETLYRVGSISKLFTDTAAMQLAEQGRLDIDQPLRNYLPEFAIKTRYPDAIEITPRQLMTHHSGLPRDRLKGFMNPHPASFTELVTDLSEDYTAYPPNLVFSYSNLGISLLGHAIQNQSGMPFADYMRQFVLMPLGMANSSFDSGLAASPLMAAGYRGRKTEIEPPLRDVPAGGLNSSIADMSRFMSMIFAGGTSSNHRILKSETITEMLRPQNTDVPLDLNFRIGLGWMLSTVGPSTIENAGAVVHHGGATTLFHSQMYLLPEHKLGVVVLANSSTSGEVVDKIATETLSLALEAKTGIRQPERSRERSKIKRGDAPLTVATVKDYVGDYTTKAGYVRIYEHGKGLRADAAGRSFDLVQRSDGLFGLDYALLGIFHIDLGPLGDIGFSRQTIMGRNLLIARAGSQEMLVGQRIKPLSNPSAWRQYLGDYEITNLEGDRKTVDRIRLIEERGFLLVEITSVDAPGETARIPLIPVSDNEALLLDSLSDGGDTVRMVTVNGEEQVLVSGYHLKKIVR